MKKTKGSKPVERDVIGAGTMRNDWTIDRNPDESIEDFTERARALVPRKTTGAATVIFRYAD